MDIIYDYYNKVDIWLDDLLEPIDVEDYDECWFIYVIDYIEFITT